MEIGLSAVVRQGVPLELGTYWRQLSSLRTLHLTAEIEVWRGATDGLAGGTDRLGSGLYEYWESDERYRASIQLPDALDLVETTATAYDGVKYRLLMSDGMMTLTSADPGQLQMPVPSPVLLVLPYVWPDDRSCSDCAMRLRDLRKAGVPVGRGRVYPGRSSTFAVTSTGRAMDLVASYRVTNWPPQHGETAVIEQLRADGAVLARIELSHFVPMPGRQDILFPWTIVWEAHWGGVAAVSRRVTYRLHWVEGDAELSDAIFNLSDQHPLSIWDNDRGIKIR